MDTLIEPYAPHHREAVVRLSLRAWAPVFESLKNVMDGEVCAVFFPDWRVTQQRAVEDVCANEQTSVWVAVSAGETVGFVALRLHEADRMGEISILAVDPAAQGQGVGGVPKADRDSDDTQGLIAYHLRQRHNIASVFFKTYRNGFYVDSALRALRFDEYRV